MFLEYFFINSKTLKFASYIHTKYYGRVNDIKHMEELSENDIKHSQELCDNDINYLQELSENDIKHLETIHSIDVSLKFTFSLEHYKKFEL